MLAPPQSIKRALSAQETALASALSFAPHLLANRAHVAWVWASGGRSAIMLADSRLVIRELAGPLPMSHTSLCFWLLPSAERAMPFFGASLVLVRSAGQHVVRIAGGTQTQNASTLMGWRLVARPRHPSLVTLAQCRSGLQVGRLCMQAADAPGVSRPCPLYRDVHWDDDAKCGQVLGGTHMYDTSAILTRGLAPGVPGASTR